MDVVLSICLCRARGGCLSRSIRRHPDFVEAYNNLGLLWLQTGKIADAKGEFQEAIRLKPDYGPAHYNLGLALLRSGEPAAADAEFKMAGSEAKQ
jgi:tetratricopeptide (TPR) repeat protein